MWHLKGQKCIPTLRIGTEIQLDSLNCLTRISWILFKHDNWGNLQGISYKKLKLFQQKVECDVDCLEAASRT